MADLAVSVLIGLGGLVIIAAIALFFLKGVSGTRRRRTAKRRARFVDLVGELIIRGDPNSRSFRRYAGDSEFRSVVLEYMRMLQGEDRERLLAAARDMGLVGRFLKALRSKDRADRVSAVEALGELADPTTVTDLVFMLHDHVPEIQVQAAAALAHIGDPMAVKSLLASMDHQDEWNAQRIADALYSFGREAVPEMSRYLQGTGRYRPLIARTLGLIGDIRAEGALIQALSSADVDLRMRAAAALGRAGTPRAVPSLLELLGDTQWEVRAQAATALGRRTDRQAIPWLRRALSDQSWWVRHNAASALVEVPGGSEALRSSLDHPDPYARDAAAAVLLSSGVAGGAVEALRSNEVTDRIAAEDLISSLVRAGKAEFFLVAGLNPAYVEALRTKG